MRLPRHTPAHTRDPLPVELDIAGYGYGPPRPNSFGQPFSGEGSCVWVVQLDSSGGWWWPVSRCGNSVKNFATKSQVLSKSFGVWHIVGRPKSSFSLGTEFAHLIRGPTEICRLFMAEKSRTVSPPPPIQSGRCDGEGEEGRRFSIRRTH